MPQKIISSITMENIKYSLVIPIYKNEGSIDRLVDRVTKLNQSLSNQLEVVFVVDGSPDHSLDRLRSVLDDLEFSAQLLAHSRNFGSFPAIRSGLEAARGDYFAVMAADLQEPSELVLSFYDSLSKDECDIAIGARGKRNDPLGSRIFSALFWGLYRRFVVKDIPPGGFDMFGCNRAFREQLLRLEESRSSLLALIYWLGFRRRTFIYDRLERLEGKSAFTFARKFNWMLDSVFAFTDLPIRLLVMIGAIGLMLSVALGSVVFIAKLCGYITVPGYAATMMVVLFFGTLNILGIGLVGTYSWRTYENSKRRPLAVVGWSCSNDKSNS
jgi:glycosyltransferase involved in cell wall biosynthesis